MTYNIDSLASIIKNCDLIIFIDNIFHLAASLGKPVWILLPTNNDFRWMEKKREVYGIKMHFIETRLKKTVGLKLFRI